MLVTDIENETCRIWRQVDVGDFILMKIGDIGDIGADIFQRQHLPPKSM